MENTINQLMEYHFEMDVKENKGANAIIGSIIKMKGLMDSPTTQQSELAIHFKSIKKRYSVSMDYYTSEDFVQEYAGLFLLVAQDLEVLEPLDYLLENTDIYKQRIRFIKDGIAREMYTVAYPDKQRVKMDDGSYKHVDIKPTSLESEIDNSDGATRLINLLTDENSLQGSKEVATPNHFIQWFLENKEQVLTQVQLTTFETLKEVYVPKTSNTKEANEERKLMLDDANLNNRNMKLQFKRIKDRVTKAYEKGFNGVYHSINYNDRRATDDVFAQYVEQADYRGWNTAEERQRELNAIIQENYNINEDFELTITKGLSKEEKRSLVRCVNGTELADNTVLRKVNNNIKEALKTRETFSIEANYPSFDYNENSFAGLSKMTDNNLMITPSGCVVERNSLQV